MHEIVVVGGGPVGSMLAALCAKDMDVTVLEEDEKAGGKACSGLVSERFMGMLPPKVRKGGIVSHRVKAAVVHFFGEKMELRKKEWSYVIDRDRFDVLMAGNARDRGAEVVYGKRVAGISGGGNRRVTVRAGRRTFGGSILCGCDGAGSVVARHIGASPAELLNGLMVYEKKAATEDFVEMWFDSRLAKDGFFWKIPRGDVVEYGCMGHALRFSALEKFFRLSGKAGLSRAAAPIPIGGVERSYADGIMIAGDAAAQTKPWSGGGLTYGLIAAECAAKTAKEATTEKDFSADFLSSYENAWKARLSSDMEAGMLLREMLKDMGPGRISSLSAAAEKLKEKADDIDFDFPFSGVLSKAVTLSGK
jgi:digeranylgeranylglycerophospholipid reductase